MTNDGRDALPTSPESITDSRNDTIIMEWTNGGAEDDLGTSACDVATVQTINRAGRNIEDNS